ncbi:MAG TPA: hypothetical protein VF315_02805, partial [Steroidobacteraceae bacterium]
ADRAKVESALSDLKSVLKGDDKALIEKKSEALASASAAIAQQAYGQSPGGAAGAAGGESGGAGSESAAKDDVVDAEFEEVKDKDRKAS